MSQHFNKLTPGEAERLAMLAEEAGEIVQAVTKVLRHGYDSFHPNELESTDPSDNRMDLAREVGDLWGIVEEMCELGDIDADLVDEACDGKWQRARRYAHHQRGNGR